MKQYTLMGQEEPVYDARPDDDFYRTPAWLSDAVLKGGSYRYVLDGGAGDGALTRAVLRRSPRAAVTAVELDRRRAEAIPSEAAVTVGDFLSWRPQGSPGVFDLIISNPPFCLWDSFAQHCLDLAGENTTVLVLGFVNVLGGQGRASFWRRNPPSSIHLSPRRASFTADGQSDSRDVCWIEWAPGRRRAEFRWLETER